MPTFDAGSVVEPIDFDFSPLADEPHLIAGLAGVTGTVKEPSAVQVQAYVNESRRELVRMRKEAGIVDEDDADAVIAALEKMNPERTRESQRQSAEILSALCSGFPSVDHLMLLPYRVMHAFGEYLSEQVLNPEVMTGAGKKQGKTLRSVSAG